MQHMKLCAPGDSLRFTLSPGDNTAGGASSGHSGAAVNGTVPAGPWTPFKNGIDPPPKAATSVNVCPSPPPLVTRKLSPASRSRYEGWNRQAGWPMIVVLSGENKSARNSANVVSPG